MGKGMASLKAPRADSSVFQRTERPGAEQGRRGVTQVLGGSAGARLGRLLQAAPGPRTMEKEKQQSM